jgi:hypothetical protein
MKATCKSNAAHFKNRTEAKNNRQASKGHAVTRRRYDREKTRHAVRSTLLRKEGDLLTVVASDGLVEGASVDEGLSLTLVEDGCDAPAVPAGLPFRFT